MEHFRERLGRLGRRGNGDRRSFGGNASGLPVATMPAAPAAPASSRRREIGELSADMVMAPGLWAGECDILIILPTTYGIRGKAASIPNVAASILLAESVFRLGRLQRARCQPPLWSDPAPHLAWQTGQKNVARWASTIRWMGVRQRRQGLPSRPYTR